MSAASPPDERFVTLRIVADPIEAEMLRDVLAQEGIVATTPGSRHSALLGGIAAAALQVPLQVRVSDLDRARAVLDALSEYDEVVPETDAARLSELDAMRERDLRAPRPLPVAGPGPYREGSLSPTTSPRKRRFAVTIAVLLPMVLYVFGAGHFYARSYARGFALLGSAVVAGALALGGHATALLALPVLMTGDALGAVAVIDEQNGETEGRFHRAAKLAPFLSVALAASIIAGGSLLGAGALAG